MQWSGAWGLRIQQAARLVQCPLLHPMPRLLYNQVVHGKDDLGCEPRNSVFLVPAFFLHLIPSFPIDLVSCLIALQIISCVALETVSLVHIKKSVFFFQIQSVVKVISSFGSATVASLILYFEFWTGIVANEPLLS